LVEGSTLIGFGEARSAKTFRGIEAATGAPLDLAEGEQVCALAGAAFPSFFRSGSRAARTLHAALPDRTPLPRPDLRRRHVVPGRGRAAPGPSRDTDVAVRSL
jgi:hypothetical protein